MPKKIICIIGTRPEAIKMAPVILKLAQEPWCEVKVLATAQHRGLLDQVLSLFDITPDIDLNLMQPNQTLPALTARLIVDLDDVLAKEQPDAIIAQGDTTTVMTSALAAFYRKIPFAHIEAGLRTGDMWSPFPEEMNRMLAGRMARWHFAPTQNAAKNLLLEGLPETDIHITGNTVIDALLSVANRNPSLPFEIPPGKRLVLVTSHRRENFGEPFEQICKAILTLARRYPDLHFIFPVHPNPNIQGAANRLLADNPAVSLIAPLDYSPFVAAMKASTLILTDSGGVQEEAPALGKPVLVLREDTERPEAVAAGVVELAGTDAERIVAYASRLLDDPQAYAKMARGISPYGDGQAAERIAKILKQDLTGAT